MASTASKPPRDFRPAAARRPDPRPEDLPHPIRRAIRGLKKYFAEFPTRLRKALDPDDRDRE